MKAIFANIKKSKVNSMSSGTKKEDNSDWKRNKEIKNKNSKENLLRLSKHSKNQKIGLEDIFLGRSKSLKKLSTRSKR